MREILFRGKRKKGDKRWVEGNLLHGYFGFGITNRYYAGSSFEVVPETVGQYTGLTDKNGKKIFEGDIVKISNDEIFEVKYEDGGFTAGLFLGDWDYGHVEVIGNIYDNPELMEVEK